MEAELCIKKAISLNPRLYYIENLARIYLDKGEFKAAIALYEDIVKVSDTYENNFNFSYGLQGQSRVGTG